MRALMEHVRTWYVDGHGTFVLDAVAMNLPTASSRRDVFVRCLQRPGHATKTSTCLYCCNKFSEALAITAHPSDLDAAGVCAYSESITLSGSRQFVALSNNAGVTPNMTGLKMWVNGDGLTSGNAVDWDALYCYTADPASVVLVEVEHILEQYIGSGQALEGFSTARIEIGEEELTLVSKAPLALASMADSPAAPNQACEFAVDVNFSVIIGSRGLKSHGADVYKEVLAYAGAVRSILFDESSDLARGRMLNGVTAEAVFENISGPRPVFGSNEPYLASVVSGKCRFPLMSSDV